MVAGSNGPYDVHERSIQSHSHSREIRTAVTSHLLEGGKLHLGVPMNHIWTDGLINPLARGTEAAV